MTPTPRVRTHAYIPCACCGKQFRNRKGRAKSNTCSARCAELHTAGQEWTTEFTCQHCGVAIPTARYVTQQRKTCSDGCATALKKRSGSRNKPTFIPTPEEIAERCLEMRNKHFDEKLREPAPCQNR